MTHIRKPSSLCVFAACMVALLLGAMAASAPLRAAEVQAPLAQAAGTVAVAKFDGINLRSGPSTAYLPVGSLAYGQNCPVIGRDTFSGWWLVQCPSGVTGWISPDVVNVVGDPNSVPLYAVSGPQPSNPEPQVPPPPPTYVGWKTSYFANQDVQGTPVLVQDVPDINFNWGYGSPGPTVPVDHFSARMERALTLAPGYYQFALRMDDGARLYVDGQPVLNDWRVGSIREINTVRYVDGSPHSYTVEYFEDSGLAAVQFVYTPSAPPTPAQPPPTGGLAVPQNQWLTQFFNNTDLAGGSIFAQYTARGLYPLDVDWGSSSPAPGVNPEYFSARFEGVFSFEPGDYQFNARVDDGVRVYIDNLLVVDAWYDGYKEPSNVFRQLGGGPHTLRIEYYERAGTAFVRVWWNRIN